QAPRGGLLLDRSNLFKSHWSNQWLTLLFSYRWLEGYALACEVQQAGPQTVVVSVADCGGDIQEWFLDTMSRAGEERAEFLIRAKCNRRLAPGVRHDYLWDEMAAARPLGKSTFRLSRQADRPPRRVTLTVTARPVTFKWSASPWRAPAAGGGLGGLRQRIEAA